MTATTNIAKFYIDSNDPVLLAGHLQTCEAEYQKLQAEVERLTTELSYVNNLLNIQTAKLEQLSGERVGLKDELVTRMNVIEMLVQAGEAALELIKNAPYNPDSDEGSVVEMLENVICEIRDGGR